MEHYIYSMNKLLFAGTLFLLCSCTKSLPQVEEPLQAKFSVEVPDANNIFENQTLRFKNESTGYTSCHWDFGNQVKSRVNEPDHFYGMHGYYTVTLTVWNDKGERATTEQPVSILCNFTGGPSGSTH